MKLNRYNVTLKLTSGLFYTTRVEAYDEAGAEICASTKAMVNGFSVSHTISINQK